VFRRLFGILRRPRLWKAALFGGLGFAAGRASKRSAEPAAQPESEAGAESPQLTARLQELADLHDSGALTDAEFAAATKKLLAS
jgi:hypothetical protein